MDRKLLLKLLENDLRLLCQEQSGEAVWLKNKEKTKEIYRLKTKKGFRYFYYDDKKKLIQIDKGTKRRPKLILTLENYRNDFPEKITFAHQGFDLTIKMKLLQ